MDDRTKSDTGLGAVCSLYSCGQPLAKSLVGGRLASIRAPIVLNWLILPCPQKPEKKMVQHSEFDVRPAKRAAGE